MNLKKLVDSLREKLRLQSTKIFENGFINSDDYKSRPRAQYEEHIHQKYINYSSIDRPLMGKETVRDTMCLIRDELAMPKRRSKDINESQRGRSYQHRQEEMSKRSKRGGRRTRNASLSRAMNEKYQELFNLRSKNSKKQSKVSSNRFFSKVEQGYFGKERTSKIPFQTNYQEDVKVSRFHDIEIENPELIESSEFETVYTSVVNFKENESVKKDKEMFSYRVAMNRNSSDQFKMSDEQRFWKNDLEFKAFFERKQSEVDDISTGVERGNENALENRLNFNTKRAKNPEVTRVFKEDNDMILGLVSDKAVKRLVEYMYDDFLDSIASSKKNKTALTLLFEVKMGSKKLNREPMLYSLMRRYQQ